MRGAAGCPVPDPCGSLAICQVGPILMGLRGGFWWLLGGWVGNWDWRRWGRWCHKPRRQESWGCSGSWDPPQALPALSQSLPAPDLASTSPLGTVLPDGVPGGCLRRRDSDGRWHLPLEVWQPKSPPDPKPQPWCREEGAHPVQGDAAGTAPMGATPKVGGWMSQQRLTRTSKLSR